MLIEIKVPQLSESVSEATLANWSVAVGDAVSRDQNLIDIETDKVVLETPSPSDGVIIEIIKNNGDTVTSGDVLAKLDTAAKATQKDKPTESLQDKQEGQVAPASSAAEAPGMSPSARKILADNNQSSDGIKGTGRGGRVTKEDAKLALNSSSPESVTGTATVPDLITLEKRTQQRVPMSRLRSRIAERLIQSKNENAILTTFNEVNMEPVMTLRKRYGEKFEKTHGLRLGFMGFFVKAVCSALEQFPIVNASVDGNDIVYHGYIDIGIAVGSPRGLVVPILRDANEKTIAEIEKEIANFGARAREGKLSIEELTGGTFSMSNGGVFGSMLSTPIINPPQSAILGIHATKERPVVENGEIVIRPMNYLALSYDHRIIDGREAVLSLVAIKDVLEDPARLVLGI